MSVLPATGIILVYPKSVRNYTAAGPFSVTDAISSFPCVSPSQASEAQLNSYYVSQVIDIPNSPRAWPWQDVGGICAVQARDYELDFNSNTRRVIFNPSGTLVESDAFLDVALIGMLFREVRTGVWSWTHNLNGRSRKISNISVKFNGTTYVSVDNPVGGESLVSTQYQITPMFTSWSTFELFKNFGFKFTVIDPGIPPIGSTANFRANIVYLYSTYYYWSNLITTSTPSVTPGSEVIINDGNNQLDQITELFVSWPVISGESEDPNTPGFSTPVAIPSRYIIFQGVNRFIFILSINSPNIPPFRKLIISGTGTQFTGKVILAILNAQLTEGSGIYTLTPDKTDDTYYDRSVSPSTTINLKKPDPFIRTGFIGD